jgi:RNA polymerase-binding protein DksA
VDLKSVQSSLREKLAQLTARVRQIESDLRDPGSKDWEEWALEAENKEVLERLSDAERHEIGAIQAAIRRIDEGTYTVCDRCGDQIAAKRLEALPYTSVCVSCAQ